MNFLLLARGASLKTARVLAVSADQQLVSRFARELTEEEAEHDRPEGPGSLHLVSGGEPSEE